MLSIFLSVPVVLMLVVSLLIDTQFVVSVNKAKAGGYDVSCLLKSPNSRSHL